MTERKKPGNSASPVRVTITPDAVFLSDARDSTGPVLQFTPAEWAAFIDTLKGAAPVLPWSSPQWATFATCHPLTVRRLPPPWIDPGITGDRPPSPRHELTGGR